MCPIVFQETIASLQDTLQAEQGRIEELRSQEGQRLTNVQRELEARSLEVRHMEEMLTTQKDEAHVQLQQIVNKHKNKQTNKHTYTSKQTNKRSNIIVMKPH